MDSYSRVVQWLKIVLPLTALVLLSTVFLLSRGIDPEATIPFAEPEMAERLRGQQVTKPFFSGTTPKGEEIVVSAEAARPGRPGEPAEAEDLQARIKLVNGRRITIAADLGKIALDKDLATFAGNVVIRTADGITVTTNRLDAELSGLAARAPGEIAGTGPIGEFSAGSMEMGAEIRNGPVHIRFTGGVKLLYDPKKPER